MTDTTKPFKKSTLTVKVVTVLTQLTNALFYILESCPYFDVHSPHNHCFKVSLDETNQIHYSLIKTQVSGSQVYVHEKF